MTSDEHEDPKAAEGEPKKEKETQKGIEDDLFSFLKDKLGARVLTAMPRQQQPSPVDDEEERERERESLRAALEFDLTPREVKEHLDRYVIGQEKAKKILSVAVCDHYNHVRRDYESPEPDREYVKQNVILLGPTGVGKTYIVRMLAQLIGVPFVKADITKFSETGYVGGDVDDLVRELVRVADGNVKLAEYGIVFLDEVDKISSAAEAISRDVSGRGVQTGLLKLLEETEVPRRSPMDMTAQFQEMMEMSQGRGKQKRTISTRHILFVVSGAFTKMDDIVRKRLNEGRVGFHTPSEEEVLEGSVLSRAMTRDFIDFGFEPEFIGRLPVRVALDDLEENDLYDILKHSEGSILRQYRESFEGYGLEAAFADSALHAIAARAIEEKTGARGLVTVLEEALREFKFHLPGTAVKRLAVTDELVDDPAAYLAKLLENPAYGAAVIGEAQVREFEADFQKEYGHKIAFDAEAVEKAVRLAEAEGAPLGEFLSKRLADYSYGLNIIRKKTRRNDFTITAAMLENPVETLEEWIKETLGSGGKA